MTWPDDIEDRYEAARNTIRYLVAAMLRNNLTPAEAGDDFADDAEALVELFDATGKLDKAEALMDAYQEAIKSGMSPEVALEALTRGDFNV